MGKLVTKLVVLLLLHLLNTFSHYFSLVWQYWCQVSRECSGEQQGAGAPGIEQL